jgi:acyl-CoA synthetase (AMP-forming)/AMP-acid ligase II/acyl carrier protein
MAAPEVATMVELLRWRAAHEPDRVGYTFLADGEKVEVNLTYGELDRRARALAAWLQRGACRGERALVLFEEGIEYLVALFGCMYAGVLAVPVHPPDPHRLQRTLPRLLTIAENAGVRFVLTSREISLASRSALVDLAVLAQAEWLALDADLDLAAADRWTDPGATPESLAYLQYTSGSTATPKGVMISHRNLIHQLRDFDMGYAHDRDSVLVSWLPATHDLGLVYGRLIPLFVGFRCVFFSPVAFMARPARWLEALTHFRGTHSPTPNFGFELAARKVTESEKLGLDLRTVRVLLNGAEPIREESERMFIEAFRPCGLDPAAVTHAMGMSEATAKIITEPIERFPAKFLWLDPAAYEENRVVTVAPRAPGSRQVASNGTTVLDTRVAIVDPRTKEVLGEDRVGEMWVSGTTVAQGYWNNPEATEAAFHARTSAGDGPFLRTGDLAFVHQGEVYLTGRLKDVIIIRGQNHHPQDIEWTLGTAHPAIRPNCAAVFAIPREGVDHLVVVTEVYQHKVEEDADVLAAVRRAVSEEHGLVPATVVLISPRALPKTSSGKIQRTRARELFESGGLEILARWDAPTADLSAPRDDGGLVEKLAVATGRRRENLLADWIQATAAALIGVDPAELETDRPVREVGLDSVTAVELVERIAAALNRPIAPTVLFDHPTIDGLARFLLEVPAVAPAAPSSAPRAPSTADVQAMSEEEAAAALLEELSKLG